MFKLYHSFIHFCHAPLGVHSTKRRHQSPEWMILSNVNCFIQGEVIGFHVLLNSLVFIDVVLYKGVSVVSSSQFSNEKLVKIFLASVSSGIRAM